MIDDRTTFIKWLAENTVTMAPSGTELQLTSGRKSNYYLDLKSVVMNWQFISQISLNLRMEIQRGNYQYISGMETGAIPLIALAVASDYGKHEMHGFYIRKEINVHGSKKQIEFSGSLQGKRVLVIEDVVTSGNSSIKAINILRNAGAYVDEILCVVDREEGGHKLFADNGVKLLSIFTGKQLLDSLANNVKG